MASSKPNPRQNDKPSSSKKKNKKPQEPASSSLKKIVLVVSESGEVRLKDAEEEKEDGGSATAGSDTQGKPNAVVDGVARTNASSRVRLVLTLVAGFYLATIWLGDGLGSTLPTRLSPRVWVYFSQIAALFKSAGDVAIEYRAEGWSCKERRWVEIDVRPFFAIDSETKENRFHRAMAFYRYERKVMNALDDYVVQRENARLIGGSESAGTSTPRIGGVRFSSVRIPHPKPGEHVEGHTYKPLSSYAKELRHEWYWTIYTRRLDRCGIPHSAPAPTPTPSLKEDEDDQKDRDHDPRDDQSPRPPEVRER